MELPPSSSDQQVLQEDYDENYEPTEEEVLEYCKVLGLDPNTEKDLLYIAKEGIKAPLPEDWKPIEDAKERNIYYFNFKTGESTWEHPCDEFYRKLLQTEREKRAVKPPSDQQATDNMISKGGKKKSITLKGKAQNGSHTNGGAPLRNGSLSGRPALGGNELGGPPPLGKLMNGSPAHGKLAPLPALGGGKPLPNIGGLPPLKAPQSLAPLRPPPSASQGSSLGGSLTSTGASRLSDPLRANSTRGGSGGVDLGSVRISTQFEEEDSESESDSQGVFKSNFAGVNLLGAEDLGLNDSDEDLDSTEDVSKELRKIMDISSDKEETSEHSGEGVGRPIAPLPPQRRGGVGESPVSSPRLPRPGAARSRDRSSSNSPLHSGPNSPPSRARANGLMVVNGRGGLSSPAVVRLEDPLFKEQARGISEAKQPAQSQHQSAVKELQEKHKLELDKLRKELAKELEKAKAELAQEQKVELASFREQLVREQLSEEKKLRAEKAAAVSELRSKVTDERDEEEARLEEEKQDYLRKIRQQLSNEREREEKRLKGENSKASHELQEQLRKEKDKTESEIRSAAASELSAVRERLTKELELEREKVRASLEEELEAVQTSRESELQTKRDEIDREHQKQLDQLQQLKEKHEQEVQSALAEIEETSSIEKLRNDALQAHQKAVEKLQAELDANLEKKKEEAKMQHQKEMEQLSARLEADLTQTKEEWAEKIAVEKQRHTAELDSTKESLQQEHEVAIQSLVSQLQSTQAELQEQKQQQSEQLAALQTEHCAKMEELQTLSEQMTQEQAQLEGRREQLVREEEEIKKEERRLALLREASAQEREELLDKQQSELRAAIERERECLAELKRSRESLEAEVQSLQQQQLTAQSSLEQLQQQQVEVKGHLSTLKDHVKQERETLSQLKQERARAVRASPAEEPQHPGVSDESSEVLSVQELELPAKGESGDSLEHEDVREKLEQGQRELRSTLMREQQSLNQTKQFLSDQQQSLAKKKSGSSKQTHRRQRDQETSKNKYDDSNLSLLKEIRVKLDQEAAVLSELEEKMRQSDKLLTHRQRESRELEDNVIVEELEQPSDEYSHHPSPSLDDLTTDIPSPKSYLTKLQASLERSKRYTHSHRARHLSSPLPTHHRRSGVSSESSEVSSEEELQVSSADECGHRVKRPHSHSSFSPATKKIMEGSVKPSSGPEKREQSMIYDSLSMINSQLGKLLDRLPETPVHSVAPPLESSGASFSNRWAEPVKRFHQTDLELAEKRRSYLGTRPAVTSTPPPLGGSQLSRSSASVRPQISTEELIHSQTDWLKEFQQSVPLSSQQTLCSRLSHPPTTQPKPSSLLHPQSGVLPSKPKLILDHGNNVKLVHI